MSKGCRRNAEVEEKWVYYPAQVFTRARAAQPRKDSPTTTAPDASKLLHPSAAIRHLSLMSIGFKEWTLICEALGSGAQSIILRKGGIAEGRAGFRFQHDEFFLFPTLFHEQAAK